MHGPARGFWASVHAPCGDGEVSPAGAWPWPRWAFSEWECSRSAVASRARPAEGAGRAGQLGRGAGAAVNGDSCRYPTVRERVAGRTWGTPGVTKGRGSPHTCLQARASRRSPSAGWALSPVLEPLSSQASTGPGLQGLESPAAPSGQGWWARAECACVCVCGGGGACA